MFHFLLKQKLWILPNWIKKFGSCNSNILVFDQSNTVPKRALLWVIFFYICTYKHHTVNHANKQTTKYTHAQQKRLARNLKWSFVLSQKIMRFSFALNVSTRRRKYADDIVCLYIYVRLCAHEHTYMRFPL